jgi:hypothetical protein
MGVNIQSVQLLEWQQLVANSYVNDDYKIYVINTSRQIGKSLLLTQLVLLSSINNKNSDVGVISLTYKQVKKIYSEITDLLNKTPIVRSNNKSELLIELINGTKIRFLSAQNSDSVRGNTFDYLFADEFAFYGEGVWSKVLQPTTIAKGKKTFITSTPRGTGNDFHKLHQLGNNPSAKNIISFSFDYTHGLFNLQEIEDIRKELPEAVFRQEYLCQFSDNGSVFKNIKDIATITEFKKPDQKEKYYIGIDVGVFVDATIAIVMDEYGNVCDMYESKRGSLTQITKDVEDFIRKWNPRKVLIELNNQGLSVYEHLRLKFQSKIEGFKTTSQSKSPLINDLQTSIEEKKISIPHYSFNKLIYEELNNYSFAYSKVNKTITYGALSGFHDDATIALALVNKLWLQHHGTQRKKLAYRMR